MKWISKKIHVDVETGEVIEKTEGYNKIKTIKNIIIKKIKIGGRQYETGTIEYRTEYRRNDRTQGRIW